jgi:phosphoenolpyruvate---glycerone phosphotransferase subunit DhaL
MNEFLQALERLASGLEKHHDEFTELDSAAGDGDLGLTAGKIAVGIRTALAEPGDSVKQLVLNLGKEISKAAPSTFGTLYASGFLAAGLAVNDDDDALCQLHTGLRAAVDKIAMRGKSEEGQRTLLDALGPATRAVESAPDLRAGLSAAAQAAAEGVEATKAMTPQHGRAGWIGERAKGIADAGATVIWRSFEAVAVK